MTAMLLFFYGVSGKKLQHQYKDFLSDFKIWNQNHTQKNGYFSRKHWKRLSIDETASSNGELYTILTNKASKRKERNYNSYDCWN
jgi:hypothetical protein